MLHLIKAFELAFDLDRNCSHSDGSFPFESELLQILQHFDIWSYLNFVVIGLL